MAYCFSWYWLVIDYQLPSTENEFKVPFSGFDLPCYTPLSIPDRYCKPLSLRIFKINRVTACILLCGPLIIGLVARLFGTGRGYSAVNLENSTNVHTTFGELYKCSRGWAGNYFPRIRECRLTFRPNIDSNAVLFSFSLHGVETMIDPFPADTIDRKPTGRTMVRKEGRLTGQRYHQWEYTFTTGKKPTLYCWLPEYVHDALTQRLDNV